MKPTLVAGLTHRHIFTVNERKTVPALYPEAAEFQRMPAVLATGFLVGLMEWAAVELLVPHMDEGEGSLGIQVSFSHLAASLPGQTVTVDVTCTAVEGRKVSFAITAHDDVDKISEGTHQRMVVPWHRFEAAVNAKAQKAGVPGLPKRPA